MWLAGIDALRAAILRKTLRVPVLRGVFAVRARRLFCLGLLSMFWHGLVAIRAPLWGLLVGSLVFGVPHLVACLRYVPRITGLRTPSFARVAGLWFVGMAVLRILVDRCFPGMLVPRYPNALELAGGSLALVGMFGYSRGGRNAQRSWAWLAWPLLLAAAWRYPWRTLGALILIHNFVGFLFWWRAAPTRADRWAAGACLGIFTAVTALFLGGAFEGVWTEARPLGILDGSLNELSLGSLIFPGASFRLGARAVSAYAFGQGVHYFVWLKAIPEQALPGAYPSSFTQSFRALRQEVSPAILRAAVVGGVSLGLVALLHSLPVARLLYLGGAAFHGYFEIAGLGLARMRSDGR